MQISPNRLLINLVVFNILCFYFSSFLKNRQAFCAWRFSISKSVDSTPGFTLRARIFLAWRDVPCISGHVRQLQPRRRSNDPYG